MNQRIRELQIQAKAESSQWLGSKPATTITYDELEKFANSIVWECMKICEDVMKKDNSALACWSAIKGTFRS